MPDLLIELFSEEIPARMQTRAGEDLKKRITDGLVEGGLTYAGAAALTTPRRLTLAVEGLLAESPTIREERKGPKVGAPDKAIEGFLRGAGLTRDQLEERDTPKGAVYFATIEKAGRPAADIVAEVLETTIRNFPWPKSMRWGNGPLRWVRPLHSILCILNDEAGAQVVPLEVEGITSGDTTAGHRFMAPNRFSVSSFDDYAAQLKRAFVLLSPDERAEHIWNDAQNMAFAAGLEVVEDRGLLAEVAGLVEWPVVLMGQIDDEFLDLPPEVLQTSMKEHQKFFSVKNPKTGRIERFITVANRETADNGATILAGNQKVLSARLADAKFFWENDLRVAKSDIAQWTRALENVTFHNKLGTQAERIDRIAALARELAPVTGADTDQAEKAARLAKADLSSEMVYEFPELQGLMGRYYIEAAGEDAAVAAVAQEHYSPLGPSDDVPTAPPSVTVALADKLDTLTGFWAIDEKPTGSKDPFALRRAALGIIRLVLDNNLRLHLDRYFDSQLVRAESASNNALRSESINDLLDEIAEHGVFGAAFQTFKEKLGELPNSDFLSLEKKIPDTSDDLLSFFHDRLKVFLRDEGIRHDIIDACIAMDGNDDLNLLVKRARALNAVIATEDGENLVQGFKRANNILTQAEEKDGVEYSYGADVKFAETDSEKALFAALDQAQAQIEPALKAEDFPTAMAAMAALRGPVDAFFEDVQVNTDNDIVRRNRLNLLSQIRQVCSSVADLTRIEG
ncbi:MULTISPECIES: glycine--tRNA ligase subunit beta [unclassified Ruegeria]|uniref:glycine--tRNA ligase subunit beta n=1 Tax=unclassified Ruegeria TaxID=2625375 RepID=UPI001488F32B|nr:MULTISPECIES: glycine--tRNA ligase subunit beta [unclassified Ruegeria]NOD45873.1 glycine--tRNA ligase subunit beta [Ruegeria sp. HKCCD5849]NOD50827.1 glycine--tRNA ligase subunit beta [Ruegeria sp. HKCCD5851]NOD67634.1 glycine--tRNA ligase subunit beta [Ruegeria sp. HKCCD7303]NOE33211.1 glycine--tRNA ligase subunit beta [Ruegeria sp. HKCCD7318]